MAMTHSLGSQMLHLSSRDHIIEFALAQVGKPYAHQGWGPKAWDCIGLFAQSGIQAGVFEYDLAAETDPEIKCYSRRPKPAILRRALERNFIKLKLEEVLPGDGLWFRDPLEQHLGVVTRVNPYWVVHARTSAGKVKHDPVRNLGYVICGWRYPGLADG